MFDLPSPMPDDLVIAADGGYTALTQHGVRCDLLIGDFDSLTCRLPSDTETMRFPPEKDDTDTALAYREGAKRGYTDFVVYGGTGGLLDHTYANLCLLHRARLDGNRMTLVGKQNLCRVIVNESLHLPFSVGKRVSVFAAGGVARGVTIKGLKYTVDDATLTPDFPLGVSNEFTDVDGYIDVKDGALLVITER